MIATAVEWLAAADPFLTGVTPRHADTWEAGSIRTIEWIAEYADESVMIEFSSDGGATWSTLATGVTEPFTWTTPATPSTDCRLRVTSLDHPALSYIVPFSLTPPPPAITSAGGGNWSDPDTWIGGIVPTGADNVVIDSGHTVIVDANSTCLNLSFADNTGRLGMQADLSLYGDFSLAEVGTNHFYSGSNLWTSGAMIFTGDAETQTINNLGTTSTSPYPARFQNIVVDKSAGRFTTNPVEGTEPGYRLGIGLSLEIVNGTFEVGRRDDIEGRTTSGTASTPAITVHENGVFRMWGSYSHIRRGNFVGDDSSKIGKMTIHGEAHLANSSTNRVNIGDIDVEDGGLLQIPYYSEGGSMREEGLNPGTVTIKNGGELKMSLNTDIWYENVTTPNRIALLEGGVVSANSSAPSWPLVAVNEGTFLYERSSSDQQVFDMDYHDLELRNSDEGAQKIWTLGADRIVSGELTNGYSATTTIVAEEAHTVTVQGTLRLNSGVLDSTDPEVDLVIADGADIRVATGALTAAPVFAGLVNLGYTSSSTAMIPGLEMPAEPGVLNDLENLNDVGLTLGADITVGGVCMIADSDLDTGDFVLTLGPSATLVEADGMTVQGTVRTMRTVAQGANEDFGGIGLEIYAAGAAPGSTEVVRTTGSPVQKSAEDGISRHFAITPAVNTGLDATVVFHYDAGDLNGFEENGLVLYVDDCSGWAESVSTIDEEANTVTGYGIESLCRLTLSTAGRCPAWCRRWT